MQESGANEPGRRAASWWAGFSLIKYQIELPKPPNKMCQQCGRLRQICTGQILGHIVCLPACLPRVLFAVFLPAFVLLFAASIRFGLVWFGFRFRKRPRIEWRWLKLNGFINGKCPAAIVWFNSNLAKANVNANADNDNQITNEQTPNVCQKHTHTHIAYLHVWISVGVGDLLISVAKVARARHRIKIIKISQNMMTLEPPKPPNPHHSTSQ